jgi:hypothetical protein
VTPDLHLFFVVAVPGSAVRYGFAAACEQGSAFAFHTMSAAMDEENLAPLLFQPFSEPIALPLLTSSFFTYLPRSKLFPLFLFYSPVHLLSWKHGRRSSEDQHCTTELFSVNLGEAEGSCEYVARWLSFCLK